jgi:putative peptide zinc metalloprotease protein
MTLEMPDHSYVTTEEPSEVPTEVVTGGGPVLCAELAEGVELLGEYEGSGYVEAPYLIRRRDGQVVQVSHLLHLVATALEPGLGYDRVAERVTAAFGREVSIANVVYLVEQKLRPAGLLRVGTGATPQVLGRANPLLALRLRLPLVPERVHRRVTRVCLPLFRPPLVVAVLAGLVALDTWMVVAQWGNLAAGMREVIYRPQLMVLITGLTIVAGVFHETGHATAARFGGARPGAMGAGIYLVWPVFYTDVTDSYRLSRAGRLRVDLGGVYFNVLFMLGAAAAYQLTGFRPLLVFLMLLQLETLAQFLPFVRLDGYYVVSDLAGVPNLFAYLKPTVVRLVCRSDGPLRQAALAKLGELNRRARVLIGLWVAFTVPVLLLNGLLLIVLLPRLAGAALGSAGIQAHAIIGGSGLDAWGRLNGVFGLVLLALPLAGILYIALRLGARARVAVRAWWHTRPALTATATATVGMVLMLQIGIFWPDTFVSAFHNAQKAHQIGQLTDTYASGDPDDVLPLSTLDPFDEPDLPSEQAAVHDPVTTLPPSGPTTAEGVDGADGSSASDGPGDDDGGLGDTGSSTTTEIGRDGHGRPSDRSVDDDRLPPFGGPRPGPAGSSPPGSSPTTPSTSPDTSAPTTTVTALPPTPGSPAPQDPPSTSPPAPAPPTTTPSQGAQLLRDLFHALFPGL